MLGPTIFELLEENENILYYILPKCATYLLRIRPARFATGKNADSDCGLKSHLYLPQSCLCFHTIHKRSQMLIGKTLDIFPFNMQNLK